MPEYPIVDDAPGFASKAPYQREAERGVSPSLIESLKQIRNAHVENSGGEFRDECLSRSWLISPEETRSVTERWRAGYNDRRRHRSLQYRTSAELAAKSGINQPTEL